jgi:hypothetical protein
MRARGYAVTASPHPQQAELCVFSVTADDMQALLAEVSNFERGSAVIAPDAFSAARRWLLNEISVTLGARGAARRI